MNTIAKALELYYIDNGQFPPGRCTASCSINSGWSTTADGSWDNLRNKLVPKYISKLPVDPISTPEAAAHAPYSDPNAYDYSYFAGNYCGVTGYRVFILVYRLEGATQTQSMDDCPPAHLGPYPASNLRVVK